MQKHIIEFFDKSKGVVVSNDTNIFLKSKEYNFIFNKQNGFFVRWGDTKESDGNPLYGLPEIADIEIDTRCYGINYGTSTEKKYVPCSFCYKSNTQHGKYMTLETFKLLFHKLPATITQIAFGIGNIQNDELGMGNPDMWNIFDFCILNGVVPNVTVNGEGITDDIADKLVSKCGAVAVSCYDKEKTYNTIKKLTDKGLKQVNIHYMISEQTFDKAFEIMSDIKTDDRLKNLNALVFLSLKPKGRSIKNHFIQLTQEKFKVIVDYALDNNIPFGMDSCSAMKFIKAIEERPNAKELEIYVDSCESTIYSLYIDVNGDFYPCSFAEKTKGWENGISILNCNDFMKDIWYNERTMKFRENSLKCKECKQSCSIYNI
jgi:radical SAM protein with 4Fe4S-binding SPASM domain